MSFTIVVNGAPTLIADRSGQSLLDVLRDQLRLTGPKFGCGEGACGACTVLVGRRAITACTTDPAQVAGQRVTTVEGLAEDGILHPVQQAWLEAGAMQCGYCTPGWLTATAALLARRAAGLITASWERLAQPAASDLEGYLRSHPIEGEGFSMPFLHVQGGDASAALAAGPVVLQAHYRAAYIAHAPLEPRSALGRWQNSRVTVWTGTSTPFRARREVAAALGLPEQDVQVIVPDYGGGFGGKHGAAVAIEAARLARAAGRPVHVQWSRHEEFHWGYLRPAALIDVSSSADASGAITGWTLTNINSGSAGIVGPYRIPHQRIAYQPAESPLPQGAYRALASTANHFARESMLDELAHQLEIDPLEFRLRHLDDERTAAVLRAAAGALGWPGDERLDAPDGSRTASGTASRTASRTASGTASGIAAGGLATSRSR